MQPSLKIKANAFNRTQTHDLPVLTEHTSPLHIDIHITGPANLPNTAELILTAHELFSHTTKVLTNALPSFGDYLGSTFELSIEPDDFPLSPGHWHLLLDVMSGEQSLAGRHAGSTEVYVRRRDESTRFTHASISLARSEYAFERETGAYFTAFKDQLPQSIDPFSDEDATQFQKTFVHDDSLSPETAYYAGQGILLSATAYWHLNQPNRREYCEEAIVRLVRTLDVLMGEATGQLHRFTCLTEDRVPAPSTIPANSLALSFLSQVYFYFCKKPLANKNYARYVLEKAGQIFRNILDTSGILDASDNTQLPDRRTIYGLAYYCLAHKSEHGQYFSHDVQYALINTTTRAVKAMRQGLETACETTPPTKVEPRGLARDIQLFQALLPVSQMTAALANRGDQKAGDNMPIILDGIKQTRQRILSPHHNSTNTPPSAPCKVPAHLLGCLYGAGRWYAHFFDTRFSAQPFSEHFEVDVNDNRHSNLADLNAAGAELHMCPEYEESSTQKEGPTLFPRS